MNNLPSPLISAVIPCRNERFHIEKCVRSILFQEPVPGGFEVIVADGMSDDGTRETLARVASQDERLRVVDNPAQTTACAMNIGVSHARGEFIAIMGAHSEYAPNYLGASLHVIKNTGADNVGGSMICRGDTVLQKAIAAAHHSGFSVGGARWHDVDYEGPADTVFGGFYRREVFERIGLFDESLLRNQDDELNLRLTLSGGTIWHSPEIRSWYCPRSSLAGLFRQYLQYGYWKVAIMRKHRRLTALRHLIPGAFVLGVITLPLLSLMYAPLSTVWLMVVASYAAANGAASFLTANRHGWHLLPYLPPVFGCYHLGYGIGFLRGMLEMIVLRRGPSPVFTRLTRVAG